MHEAGGHCLLAPVAALAPEARPLREGHVEPRTALALSSSHSNWEKPKVIRQAASDLQAQACSRIRFYPAAQLT